MEFLMLLDKNYLFIGGGILFLLIIITIVLFKPSKNSVKKVEEKVLTEEQKKAKRELELVLEQMQKDVVEQHNDPVMSFEQEQEENAIISYQELIQAKEELKEKTIKSEDEEMLIIEEDKSVIKNKPIDYNETKKFRNSDFISPIYGRMDQELDDYPKDNVIVKDTEEEPVIHQLKEEIKKNDEFLRSLKDFRNNL